MPQPDSGPTSGSFISQRLRLNYLDWGNHGAPVLILQHGGRDHAHSWDWVARELSQDWHVIAPDLLGHGNSAWSPDGSYSMSSFIYDFTQLVRHFGNNGPVRIVAHSLGGFIALRYAGLYPETVHKLAVIESWNIPPEFAERLAVMPIDEIWRSWIDERRTIGAKSGKAYPTIEAAVQRMMAENPHLSAAQARHLTVHGVTINEDGTYSWKFDNYVYSVPPLDLTEEQIIHLRGRISCPVLLMRGANSWAIDPAAHGITRQFKDARHVTFEDAGHWPHHDKTENFLAAIRDFL